METQITGLRSVFGIEWTISSYVAEQSQLAIGCFSIHLDGRRYGVVEQDATVMGNSYYAVKRRLLRKGKHLSEFESFGAIEIASSYRSVVYGASGSPTLCNSKSMVEEFRKNDINWCPDGDAAFDDGGHVFHMDSKNGDRVRLIGFLNSVSSFDFESSVSESWMESEYFYRVLGVWVQEFDDVRLRKAQEIISGTRH